MRGSSKKVATTASRPKLSMASLRWGTLLATTTTLTTTLDTMMKLIVLAALVSLTAAQDLAKLMDKNNDGIIEKSEVGADDGWDQSSCIADAIGNGDGKVQVSEFSDVMTKGQDPAFIQKNAEKIAKCSGCSVSINMILFSLASLMALIWK